MASKQDDPSVGTGMLGGFLHENSGIGLFYGNFSAIGVQFSLFWECWE